MRFGHPLWLLETFVDPRYFRGTIYRAATWQYVGDTRGFRRTRKGYSATAQTPKHRLQLDKLLRTVLPCCGAVTLGCAATNDQSRFCALATRTPTSVAIRDPMTGMPSAGSGSGKNSAFYGREPFKCLQLDDQRLETNKVGADVLQQSRVVPFGCKRDLVSQVRRPVVDRSGREHQNPRLNAFSDDPAHKAIVTRLAPWRGVFLLRKLGDSSMTTRS